MSAAIDPKRIVLAAGGTGGHVFPAEAMAEALLGRGYDLALLTDARGQAYGGALGRLPTYPLRAGGIAGRGVLRRIKAVADLGVGVLQARRLLAELKPAVVVGFGGYASIPGMVAAIRRGVPTVIHEQNAVLGRANRLLAPHVSRIATSFAEVAALPRAARVELVGMPVRPAIAALADAPFPALSEDGLIEILVIGGSQGATVLSQVVPAAMTALPAAMKARIRLSQQCRPADIEAARAAYADSGLAVELATFFDDVPQRLARAHLAIARAGASTVAEFTAAGRPAILVPYPHAIDDHQTANAQAIAEKGGAWLMPQDAFTAESLAARLETLFAQPRTLESAAACARAAGTPDAAARLADLVAALPPETEETKR
ncbi:undecaprenyldiphospho-muramoylpentapeptide beta-N-acetylglucosaminyltransferase [Oleispirillum naphthae]|uniref:undecaprenyldiphospho-muramoylpentapeptide beta-N-acetylglucosaminyltransferase n=1 Tax=Oleispirillum naphthae TaxID=2838853 RepID=UPI0030822F33